MPQQQPKKRNPYKRLIRASRNATPGDGGGGFKSPPFLSFNPAIEAERRAGQRGVSDVAQDSRIAARRGRRTKRTELGDIKTTAQRGRQDLGRELHRGLLGIEQTRGDVQQRQVRGMQDFGFALDSLARKYGSLGRQQTQVANAQGLGESVLATSAAARERNQAIETQPITIGQERLGQDTATALGRLGIEEGQLRQDIQTGRSRLGEDTRHDRGLVKREYKQGIRDLYIRLQRAIREQRIGDIDLIKQEIFEARRNRPGVFSRHGRKSKGDR